jgi:hypothetical protein
VIFLFLFAIEVRVEGKSSDGKFLLEESKMTIECWSWSLELETIFLKKHLKSLTMLGAFIVELKQLKEVTIVEILHEVSLLCFRI